MKVRFLLVLVGVLGLLAAACGGGDGDGDGGDDEGGDRGGGVSGCNEGDVDGGGEGEVEGGGGDRGGTTGDGKKRPRQSCHALSVSALIARHPDCPLFFVKAVHSLMWPGYTLSGVVM